MVDLNPQISQWIDSFCFGRPMTERLTIFFGGGITMQHKGTRKPGGSGNLLYDSFLDTWGNDDFQNNLPLEQKSYFSVLGVVSQELRDQCTVVLDQVLEREKFGEGTPSGRYKIPLQLLLDRSDADTKAGNTIGDILKAFNLEHTNLKNKIDPFVADAVKRS